MKSIMKKALCGILTALTVFSTFTIFASFKADAATGYDRGYNQSMAGTGKVVAE